MIAQLILSHVYPDLVALPFIERFGGVAYPVAKYDDGGAATAFPVSCEVSEADCSEDQRSQLLVPDDAKKSVAYFEIVDGMRRVGLFNNNPNTEIWTGRARFVCWLNTQLLGESACNAAGALALQVWKTLRLRTIENPPELPNARYEIRVAGEVLKDRAIFGRYTYDDRAQYLVYPFDFFALDIELKAIVSLNCLPVYVPNTPTDCLDFSRL